MQTEYAELNYLQEKPIILYLLENLFYLSASGQRLILGKNHLLLYLFPGNLSCRRDFRKIHSKRDRIRNEPNIIRIRVFGGEGSVMCRFNKGDQAELGNMSDYESPSFY